MPLVLLTVSSTVRAHRPRILGSAPRVLLSLFTPTLSPCVCSTISMPEKLGREGFPATALFTVSRTRGCLGKKAPPFLLLDNLDSCANLPPPFQPPTSTLRHSRREALIQPQKFLPDTFSQGNGCLCNFRYLHIKTNPCKTPLCFNLDQEAIALPHHHRHRHCHPPPPPSSL